MDLNVTQQILDASIAQIQVIILALEDILGSLTVVGDSTVSGFALDDTFAIGVAAESQSALTGESGSRVVHNVTGKDGVDRCVELAAVGKSAGKGHGGIIRSSGGGSHTDIAAVFDGAKQGIEIIGKDDGKSAFLSLHIVGTIGAAFRHTEDRHTVTVKDIDGTGVGQLKSLISADGQVGIGVDGGSGGVIDNGSRSCCVENISHMKSQSTAVEETCVEVGVGIDIDETEVDIFLVLSKSDDSFRTAVADGDGSVFSVVHCARDHQFFGVDHDLALVLDGCIGSDHLLADMLIIAENQRSVVDHRSLETIFSVVELNGSFVDEVGTAVGSEDHVCVGRILGADDDGTGIEELILTEGDGGSCLYPVSIDIDSTGVVQSQEGGSSGFFIEVDDT